MQVLRLPPYPLSISYDVPAASAVYDLIIEEEDTKEIILEKRLTSTTGKKINYTFETDEWHMYDKVYPLSIKEIDFASVTNRSLTSNVATLTTSAAHPFVVGDSVIVTGVNETFNGTQTITAKTSTTISYAKTATNVVAAAVSPVGRIAKVSGDIVVEDALEIKRPYVDPNSLASTATEIAEYKKQEFLARSIIDAVLEEGFYYKKKTIEYVGLGTDYAPINYKSHKVLKVYQDNILHYDSSLATPAIFGITFKLSDNGTAVIKDLEGEEYNRSEQAPLFLPTAQSDWLGPIGYGNSFDNQSDFTFVLETGYKVVPLDIKEATLMLIDDIRCGKLDYYKRYVTTYNTDQFKLQFHKSILDGTGNLLVDKILSKYIADSRVKIGVL
jgi:hypothetical protein